MKLETAEQLAMQILTALQPHCKKINIAGSIRRRKPDVKDIEIICLPKTEIVQTDLFGQTTKTQRCTGFIQALSGCMKELKKGNIMMGRYAQMLVCDAVLLDLFTPVEEDYYRQYAIRTGDKDYSKNVIAAAWLKKGWCGVKGIGLRKKADCIAHLQPDGPTEWELINTTSPSLPPVWENEKDFFNWLGVEWLPPEMRTGEGYYTRRNFEAR